MDLSVIIVNYNVKYFLHQCIRSCLNSKGNIQFEIIVVDNNSNDESVAFIGQKFPHISVIANTKNVGFSKANNQGIEVSKGRYILLLNPDTIVEEYTFEKVIQFMDHTADAGGLGVKMIDGMGNYLPESKRGLPLPDTALYKILGLSKLMPKSKLFNRYHLGYLDKDQIHEVEVLSGAFMLLRKALIDQIGGLDESFFMYGEDVDLSYRIRLAGYKNYYFPQTTIIHYKGESTKKGSVKYIKIFYQAMMIFAKKHFAPNKALFYRFFIHPAIFMSALLALASSFIKKYIFIILDLIALILGLFLFKQIYAHYTGLVFDQQITNLGIVIFSSIWVLNQFINGGYHKPIHISKNILLALMGSVLVLAIYGILPEHIRFSRAIILFGAIYYLGIVILSRYFFHYINPENFKISKIKKRRISIVGDVNQINLFKEQIRYNGSSNKQVECVIPLHEHKHDLKENKFYFSSLDKIKSIIGVMHISELVLCAESMSNSKIISTIEQLADANITVKIAHLSDQYLIDSENEKKLEHLNIKEL